MTKEKNCSFDCTVDLLVAGAGAAGMTAALVGAIEGLEVVICEKSDKVGGITSTSAGTVWIPGSTQSEQAGVPDSIEAASVYLASAIGAADGGTADGEAERRAFLESGRQMLDYLARLSHVRFTAGKAHPDYLANHPGAAFGGRALSVIPFDGRTLEKDFERVRPTRSEFMALGGMMVAKADIPFLLKPFASMAAFQHTARMLLRCGWDKGRFMVGQIRDGTTFQLDTVTQRRVRMTNRRGLNMEGADVEGVMRYVVASDSGQVAEMHRKQWRREIMRQAAVKR